MSTLRRSSRQAESHVTMETKNGNPSSSTPKTSQGRTNKNTSAGRKSTASGSKKTSKTVTNTSTPFKRKAQDQPEKQIDKRQKMDELTQEEKMAVVDEISQLLKPLLENLGAILSAFPQYKEQVWYQSLETRYQLLPTLPANTKSREGLAEREELSPFTKGGIPFSIPVETMTPAETETLLLLLRRFEDLENCRNKTVVQALELPSPSNYCYGPVYRRCQRNPKQAVRDGRLGTAIPIELLHPCFRTFTYWSFQNPYPFPRPHWEDKRDIDKSSFIRVYQAVYHLLFSMPVFYTAHDDRMEELKKALLQIFPDNEHFQWCANVPADQGISEGTPVRYKVDLVYRCKKTLVPLIFVEVKLELGEGGNPFWQNHRLYQSYIKENMQSCRNGAPVFFVQLCGTHLGIGGGFCDAINDNKPPVVLQLGGYVNLQHDFIGRNLREGVNTLWALHEAIKQIPLAWADFDSRHALLNVPRYGPNPIFEIIDVLHPGVVYLAKYRQGSNGEGSPDSSTYVVKIIYSGVAAEGYGRAVHRHLAKHDMAPKYIFAFDVATSGPLSKDVPLETHHVMEYLPPPSNESTGWISLLELEERFPQVASGSKEKIDTALMQIIHVLQKENYVHGDFRPNNLLIHIKIIHSSDRESCMILERPDSSFPYLKVVDFDWAGVAGVAIYPLNRNPDVSWPGEDGNPISLGDDESMIRSWLKHWPGQAPVPASVSVEERGEAAVTLQIHHE